MVQHSQQSSKHLWISIILNFYKLNHGRTFVHAEPEKVICVLGTGNLLINETSKLYDEVDCIIVLYAMRYVSEMDLRVQGVLSSW